MSEVKKQYNLNIPSEAFEAKLDECHFEPALADYLFNLFRTVEGQVKALDSFVPFHIELEIY